MTARFPVPEARRDTNLRDEWNGVALPLTSGTAETSVSGKTARIPVREEMH